MINILILQIVVAVFAIVLPFFCKIEVITQEQAIKRLMWGNRNG